MRVKDLVEKVGFRHIAGKTALEKELTGLYCCDLLSWVMSHAKQGDAWITVQTHVNVVAIASLLDLGCIIIPEDAEIDNATVDKAVDEDIAILATHLSSFEIFKRLYEQGLR
ncbi:AraC family transcriptional regulator [Geosporobacter ferrireducens]|nr:AraC family transcriptional regulator [Geosporobacter ferrireducens]MTI55152.1 AraC family transcriptional regulator [Geosporobacter ferrireducens]